MYLTAIMDVYSHKNVGCPISNSLGAKLGKEVFDKAVPHMGI
jgi:hypothetical protein